MTYTAIINPRTDPSEIHTKTTELPLDLIRLEHQTVFKKQFANGIVCLGRFRVGRDLPCLRTAGSLRLYCLQSAASVVHVNIVSMLIAYTYLQKTLTETPRT